MFSQSEFIERQHPVIYREHHEVTEITDQFVTNTAIQYWNNDEHVATLHYSRDARKFVLQVHRYDNVIASVYAEDIYKDLLTNLMIAHNHVKASLDFVGCEYNKFVSFRLLGVDCEIYHGYLGYTSSDIECRNLMLCPVEMCNFMRVTPIYGDTLSFIGKPGVRYSYLTEVLDNLVELKEFLGLGDVLRLHEGYYLLSKKN